MEKIKHLEEKSDFSKVLEYIQRYFTESSNILIQFTDAYAEYKQGEINLDLFLNKLDFLIFDIKHDILPVISDIGDTCENIIDKFKKDK